jgi:hypothetical protein
MSLAITPPAWMDDGACVQIGPGLFYPHEGSSVSNPYAEAKAVCATCPVQVQCLEYALEVDDRHGVWGGLAPRERAELRTQVRTQGIRFSEAQRLVREWETVKANGGTVADVAARHRISPDAYSKRVERARTILRRGGHVEPVPNTPAMAEAAQILDGLPVESEPWVIAQRRAALDEKRSEGAA